MVGESGSGKSVTALSVRAAPAVRDAIPAGEVLFKGQDLLKADAAALQKMRGNDISMIFQEPMTSLNPLHKVEKQVGEILRQHRGLVARRPRGTGRWSFWRRSASATRRPASAPIRTSSPAGSASA